MNIYFIAFIACIDGLAHAYGNPAALARDQAQSCTKPLILSIT